MTTELHTYLFNADVTSELHLIPEGAPKAPPTILVELYFEDVAALAALKGQNNSLKLNAPA